jgi:hypothetical protein
MQNKSPPSATEDQTLFGDKFDKDIQQQQTLPWEHPFIEEEHGIKGPPFFPFSFSPPIVIYGNGFLRVNVRNN